MPDVTTPSRLDKLKAIDDMGVSWLEQCPKDHGLKDYCAVQSCGDCWIKSLEMAEGGEQYE